MSGQAQCRCGQAFDDKRIECVTCRTYQCATCHKVTGWEDGADDDMPHSCSACWMKAMGPRQGQAGAMPLWAPCATPACLSFVPARGGLCEQCQESAAIGAGR